MDFFLGIDLGTSSVKVIIIDRNGNVVNSAKKEYPLHQPKSGWAEQNPDDWFKAIYKATNELLNKTKVSSDTIRSIGLTGQMHGLVALDYKDEFVYPCIIWADRRTTAEVKEIKEKLNKNLLTTLGNPVVNGFTAPKLLWLIKHLGKEKIKSILLPKDYLGFIMTGEKKSDFSDASATLLFDVKNKSWAYEVLEELGIPENILPSLISPGSVIGKLQKDIASRLNLKAGIPVIAAGGDAPLSALSNGITESGNISVTIGTGGQILAVLDEYKMDNDLRLHTLCHALPGKWYVMAAIASAGYCLQWWRDGFIKVGNRKDKITYEFLDKEAGTVSPAAEGLIFLPYLNGERSPHLNPYATASLFGLTAKHTNAHVVRSIMEGVSFAVKENLDIIENMGIEIGQIRMTGGATKSKLWREIFATILNKPIYTAREERGSAYGAALSAANSFGVYNNLEEAFQSISNDLILTEPSNDNLEIYNKAFSLYKKIYRNNKELYPMLAKLID